ncbi:MAG TPA: DNA polymerase III subunit gamma/tau [Vicinamibacterales bacterium]|nr:DNA polymerase III subunit gamma/tau [Vicinamibacterales bacterium]
MALARKWRPQKFEDVIGQRGTIDTLKNAIVSGRLAQSFIFAGPRGVGKTTTARILARALNCVKGPTAEPCGKCDACTEIAEGRDVDVLEIDGATYTGVDAVREVIVEPLSISPMRDRFKIFIIDEVHRLSKQAFDALLKSIEEPPPYVKFMMATTDLHSVPATIQSRSQVFELKTLPFAAIRDQLKQVTTREKVKVEDAALSLVARAAEGSMRDALSALDQVLAFTSDAVTAADVSTVLGLIGRDAQFEIAEIVAREDAAAVFGAAGKVIEAGFDLRVVCRELARLVRDLLVIRVDASRLNDPEIAAENERERMKALADQYSREDLMRAFDLLSRSEYEIKRSSQPRHQFEMTLIEWIHLRKLTPLTELLTGSAGSSGSMGSGGSVGAARPQAAPRSGPMASAPPAPRPSPAAATVPSAPRPPAPPSAASTSSAPVPPAVSSVSSAGSDQKGALLAAIRDGNKMLYSMVFAQAQKVELGDDALVLTFAPQHRSLKTQLEGKRAWVEQIARSVTGRAIRLVAKDGEGASVPVAGPVDAARTSALRARAKAEPVVQNVLDVFGGDIDSVEEID